MRRFLMVDDEELIRTGFREKIDWQALGFEFLEPCANGLQALEMVGRYRPDVVMTDICMPQMDGLELCRALAQDHPEVRLVVLSGHDDFEYAREALRNRVVDYLLKPVTSDELRTFLVKLVRDLDKPKLPTESEALHLLLEGAVGDQGLSWLGGESRPGDLWCAGRLSLFPFSEERLTPAALLHRVDHVLGEGPRPRPGLARTALGKGAQAAHIDLAFFGSDPESTALKAVRDSTKLLETFRQAGLRGCGALGPVGTSAQLPFSRVEAVDTTLLRFFRPGMFQAAVLPWAPAKAHRPFDGLASRVETLVREGDRPALADLIEDFPRKLRTEPGSGRWIRQDLAALLASGEAMDLDSCPGSAELVRAFEERIQRGLGAATEQGASLADRALKRLGEQIHRRLSESELSIDDVSEDLLVSPSYLGKLLRRKWGTNFSQILRQARVSKAKELLAATNLTTTRIAEQTGFNDYRYFSNQFKRSAGLTPSEYRRQTRSAS